MSGGLCEFVTMIYSSFMDPLRRSFASKCVVHMVKLTFKILNSIMMTTLLIHTIMRSRLGSAKITLISHTNQKLLIAAL